MKDETRLQPNTKYSESAAHHLELRGAKSRQTPGVPAHRATMYATPVRTEHETRVHGSCVGALMCNVLDQADADVQLEVSILGSCT